MIDNIVYLNTDETRKLLRGIRPRVRLASIIFELARVTFLLTVGYVVGECSTVPTNVSAASVYGYDSLYVLTTVTVAFVITLMHRHNLLWDMNQLTEHLKDMKGLSWC